MAYQTIYRLQGTNREGQLFIVHISDTTSGVGTPTYHDLTLTSLEINVDNSDDDRFSIVASKTLQFSFVPTTTYGLSIFLSGADNKFLVEVYAANTSILIFKGYLLTDDNREALLPKSADGSWAMFDVVMTASDNVPTLKEIPLTDDTGANPRGFYTAIEFIAWALQKTGLELPINVIDGIYYALDPETEGNWYNTIYLRSKTFEEDINVSVNCYEALQIILKGRIIVQEWGEWWILSRAEQQGAAYNIFRYDFEGAYINVDENTYTKTIGINHAIKLAEKDAYVIPSRPHKYDQLEYKYELPIEIINNMDFSRGAQTSWTPGTLTALYDIDDWDLVKFGGGSPEITAKIKRLFTDINQTYETEKYIVLSGGATVLNFIRTQEGVYMHSKDKCIFSIDMKMATDHNTSGWQNLQIGQLRFVADDGTIYTCNTVASTGAIGEWINTGGTAGGTNGRAVNYEYQQTITDDREWANISVETRPVPKDGTLYVLLFANMLYPSEEIHYTNLTFDYIPYINGDYSKYGGQYHKLSQAGDCKANRIELVEVSDSPKSIFKGAMHRASGGAGDPVLTSVAFAHYPEGSGALIGFEKYGKYQAYLYWHQHFNPSVLIQGSLTGLNSDTNPSDLPGLLHQYEFDFSTNDDFTAGKWFCVLSYKQDLINCKWSAVFAQVIDNTVGHPYNAVEEFKYTAE